MKTCDISTQRGESSVDVMATLCHEIELSGSVGALFR
jgi:hypothetical protein